MRHRLRWLQYMLSHKVLGSSAIRVPDICVAFGIDGFCITHIFHQPEHMKRITMPSLECNEQ